MLDKLLPIEKKYLTIQQQLMEPEMMTNSKKAIELNKELSRLQEVYDFIQEYKKYHQQLLDAKELIVTNTDADMLTMAREEKQDAEAQLRDLEHKLTVALLPKDPNDEKNIFLEIRPAAGGDEA